MSQIRNNEFIMRKYRRPFYTEQPAPVAAALLLLDIGVSLSDGDRDSFALRALVIY